MLLAVKTKSAKRGEFMLSKRQELILKLIVGETKEEGDAN